MPILADEVIDRLKLEPLPLEGGYFSQTYASGQIGNYERRRHPQPVGTAIFFLLTADTFSALHRLRADEIYHFYLGDPVELYEMSEGQVTKTELGQDIFRGQNVQHTVLAGGWQGSRLKAGGTWALMGTTMVPGFTWEDFELGSRGELIAQFPQYASLIRSLTHQ